MLRRLLPLAAGLLSLGWGPSAAQAEPAPRRESGTVAAGWWEALHVADLNGTPIPFPGRWLVVVFISPECPVARAELPVLNRLAAEFSPRGVTLVGAYADPTLALPALREEAAASGLAFATADDRAQRLVRATGATYTPEVFVFTRDGTRLYRGRIDDRVQDFGGARPKATRENLREVLAALVAGEAGPFPTQPGFGCTIPEQVKR